MRWTTPAGGMFLWVTLRDGTDATTLLRAALEHQVAFVPGLLRKRRWKLDPAAKLLARSPRPHRRGRATVEHGDGGDPLTPPAVIPSSVARTRGSPTPARRMVGLTMGVLLVVAVAIRAVQEERALRAELPGYDQHRGQVKYRRIPYLW